MSAMTYLDQVVSCRVAPLDRTSGVPVLEQINIFLACSRQKPDDSGLWVMWSNTTHHLDQKVVTGLPLQVTMLRAANDTESDDNE